MLRHSCNEDIPPRRGDTTMTRPADYVWSPTVLMSMISSNCAEGCDARSSMRAHTHILKMPQDQVLLLMSVIKPSLPRVLVFPQVGVKMKLFSQ